MSLAFIVLIVFLAVYAIIVGCASSLKKRVYDERQKYMQCIAYKYGFYTLILATLGNAYIEYRLKTSWGTPLAEAFVIICIGLLVFFTICVYKDAYFSYAEVSGKNMIKNIVIFLLLGGANLYTGITQQLESVAQHTNARFDNIPLITGIVLLLSQAIIIVRMLMESRQKEEE